jgi:hypothetical protein
MAGWSSRSDRSNRRPCVRGGVGVGGEWLVGHGGSRSKCACVGGAGWPPSICIRVYRLPPGGRKTGRSLISEGKYMILRQLCKE